MPSWFWPLAGTMLLLVACANFSGNDAVVLAAQAYIATFHIGAVMYHLRLGHHPAVAAAPGIFTVFAFAVVALRTNVVVAFVGTLACGVVAAVLCKIIVTAPGANEEAYLLHDEDEQSPAARAQAYISSGPQ